MKRLLILGVLLILAGCGGSGGSSIGAIYEGSWTGVAQQVGGSKTHNFKVNMAYEGKDDYSEYISFSWYSDTILALNGIMPGTSGGLVTIEYSDATGDLTILANITGNTMQGSYAVQLTGEEMILYNFTLTRQ